MMQGLAGWMSLTGEPDGPPTQERALARRPLGRLRRRRSRCSPASGARAATASAATATSRCSRPRSHELMYVGTWAASRGLRAAAAGELGAPVDRAVPELRDRRRLDRRRLPEAERSGARSATRSGRPELASDERFADFAARDRAPRRAGADRSRRRSRRARRAEWLDAAARRRRPVRAGQRRRARRSPTRRSPRGRRRRARAPALGTGAPGRDAAAARRRAERRSRRAPLRGEHTDEVLAELCGYDAERIERLRASGAFG